MRRTLTILVVGLLVAVLAIGGIAPAVSAHGDDTQTPYANEYDTENATDAYAAMMADWMATRMGPDGVEAFEAETGTTIEAVAHAMAEQMGPAAGIWNESSTSQYGPGWGQGYQAPGSGYGPGMQFGPGMHHGPHMGMGWGVGPSTGDRYGPTAYGDQPGAYGDQPGTYGGQGYQPGAYGGQGQGFFGGFGPGNWFGSGGHGGHGMGGGMGGW